MLAAASAPSSERREAVTDGRQHASEPGGSAARAPRTAALAGALFLLAFGAGALQILVRERELPALDASYLPSINRSLAEQDYAQALAQMRLAALLDPRTATVRMSLLPAMARLGHDTGDQAAETFALRRMATLDSRNPRLRAELAVALLRGAAPGSPALAEAQAHAEFVRQRLPRLPGAYLLLADVAQARGDHAKAETWRRLAAKLEAQAEQEPAP